MAEPPPSMLRRFVECSALALVAACVGSGMRTRSVHPETRSALREDPIASAAPIETARLEPPSTTSSAWVEWLCAGRKTAEAPPPVRTVAPRQAVAPPSTPVHREKVETADAAVRCDLVARIAARAGWSRDDRRRGTVADWFDRWSAARRRLRDDGAPGSVATHRRFASEHDDLCERLGRDFESNEAAAIARAVPIFTWDEASGSLRRVDADGKPFPLAVGVPEVVTVDTSEVVTTVASQ